MSRIAANGVEYYVNQAGGGSPLLLLHGFTNSAMWEPQMAAWGRHFTLIAPDLLGHGQSDAPADAERYSMEHTVADLVTVLDTLGVSKTHVVGYSMGGRVALALAVAHPARVGGLVLESASPGLAKAEERAARLAADEALAARIERDGIEAFVDEWERLPLWSSQAAMPAEVRARLRAERLRNTAVGLAGSLRGLGSGAQPPLHDALYTLRVPVLCMAGALDYKFVAQAEDMVVALPLGELAIMAEAGHAVHLEQPDRFNQAVLDFLTQPPVAGRVA